ncbi:hypothetical protein BFL43_12185 [Williamsia sp. 1135]|nr:hypothetical protein BFL43_12185 [Williamsia sp. 1135]
MSTLIGTLDGRFGTLDGQFGTLDGPTTVSWPRTFWTEEERAKRCDRRGKNVRSGPRRPSERASKIQHS